MPVSDHADIVERLAALETLSRVPRSELRWLAERGELLRFEWGSTVARRGQSIERLYVVLSGRLVIHLSLGKGALKVMEWQAGSFTGILPYSRMSGSPGDVVALEATQLWALGREHLPALIRECQAITSICVHEMVDRARQFASSDSQQEKLASLGKLAAGLAHELNNPASAVARNAGELQATVMELEAASRALGTAGLSDEDLVVVNGIRSRCVDRAGVRVLSSVERADREEAFLDWLERRGMEPSAADSLSDSATTLQDLELLAGSLGRTQLAAAIHWIAAGCRVRQLIAETHSAASRVHALVAAVKGFTHMDRAAAPTPIDVNRSLSDTVSVLAGKAREKSVGLALDVAPDLPRIQAVGGELNQVWANLIENAIDAVTDGGAVRVTAGLEGNPVVVRVLDDGPGVPANLQTRIFDPFFTTKTVGSGTGLGLDIVRRLVYRANGSIDLVSAPGRTEFRVALPIRSGSGEETE